MNLENKPYKIIEIIENTKNNNNIKNKKTLIEIHLQIQANAKTNGWAGLAARQGVTPARFKVKIKAAAINQAANHMLQTWLAEYFNIPKQNIDLLSGINHPLKKLRFTFLNTSKILNISKAEETLQKLENLYNQLLNNAAELEKIKNEENQQICLF